MAQDLFRDLKVIELSSVLAGPLVGTFFAELGARVIKIENKNTNGDVTRRWKLPGEAVETKVSAYYSSANYGKTVIFLDLNSASDRNELGELLRTADIVISNFRKEKSQQFEIDYRSVHKINEKVIYGEISGYGKVDDRIAYDVVLQAESGYMSMNGTKESGPVKLPVAFMDVLTAHQLKEGLLCALYRRERSGEGAFVHVSLLDAAISSLTNQASNYLMTGYIPSRIGTLHPNLAPYGELFESSDGVTFVLAIGSDSQFGSLCELIQKNELAKDERFVSNQQRVKNRTELHDILKEAFSGKDMSHLTSVFHETHIPAGVVRPVDEVLDNDAARKLILEEEIEGVMTKRIKTAVFTMEF